MITLAEIIERQKRRTDNLIAQIRAKEDEDFKRKLSILVAKEKETWDKLKSFRFA